MHRATGRCHIRTEALVVFHVTSGQVFGGGVVKLGKQICRHLAQGVYQHVQAATVGHANDDFLDATGTGLLDQGVNGSDETLTTFE